MQWPAPGIRSRYRSHRHSLLALTASIRAVRRTRPSSSSSRTGCRRRIRCRRRWKNGALRSRRPRAAPSSRRCFPSQQLGKAFDHYDMARDGIADFTYVNPGYQPGRFPIIAAGELPFLIGERQGRHSRDRRLVPQIRRERDEGREILLLLHSRSGDLAFEQEEDHGAGRHQGHEGPALAGHGRRLGDAARRHQCAGQRDRSARCAWRRASPRR